MSAVVESILRDPGLRIVVSLLVQSTLITMLGLAVSRYLRWDAAKREWVLRVTLVCVLMVPVATIVIHKSRLSVSWLQPRLAAIHADAEWRPDQQAEHVFMPASTPFAVETSWPETIVPDAATVRSLDTRKLTRALVLIWMFGLLIRSSRLITGFFQARRLALRADPLDPQAVARLLSDVPAGVAVHHLRFGVSDRIGAPAALGLFRRTILLPSDLWSRLPECQIRAVVHHELAHVLRFDPAWLLVQHAAGTLFWPQPLIHILNRTLAQAREEVCDNFVLRTYRSADYSRTLLKVASTAKPAPELAVSLLSGRWRLEQRIHNILDTRRITMTKARRTYMTASAFGIGVFAMAIAVAMPTAADEELAGESAAAHIAEESILAEAAEAEEKLVLTDSSDFPRDEEVRESKQAHSDFGTLARTATRRPDEPQSEVAELRREMHELKAQLQELMHAFHRRGQEGRFSSPDSRRRNEEVHIKEIFFDDELRRAEKERGSIQKRNVWIADGQQPSAASRRIRKSAPEPRIAAARAKLATLIAHQNVLKEQLEMNARAIEETREMLRDHDRRLEESERREVLRDHERRLEESERRRDDDR